MEFQIYQFIVPVISLIILIRIGLQYTKRKKSLFSTAIWYFFWITIALLALFPDLISKNIASTFGFASNINAIIFVALGLLFLIIFYLSSSLDRVESQLTDLVRTIALSNEVKDNTRSKTTTKNNKSKNVQNN